ncbi:hypothetical protein QBC38DRAFT_355228 [Podospora fimiseda]|uniref:Uncharacterized protein n=1 Tax=Podospora fimiseda TaxID=252190 RepID=A0AAN7H0Z0_9PEZI|nr:hypothetical protein QBC38DRAFT_355228 [Podospora fimiseda]
MSPSVDQRRLSCLSVNHFPPPIAASEVFGRPMDPAPAPLVYINGWPGVGKEAVAECLTLLLGRDKSVLIDVRSVGLDGDNGFDQSPLLTPEHPRYFSFDLDVDSIQAGSAEESDVSPGDDAAALPSSGANLTRLLTQPSYSSRIAVLAACAPDTPAGRGTIRTLEAAASRSGRLFIPIALECAPAEHVRRAGSLQRQCSYKARRTSAPGSNPGNTLSLDLSGHGNGRFQQKLAMPMQEGLTVDVTCSPAFEAALQIVGFVKGCVAERDAELCSTSSSSATTTPTDSCKGEKDWGVSD